MITLLGIIIGDNMDIFEGVSLGDILGLFTLAKTSGFAVQVQFNQSDWRKIDKTVFTNLGNHIRQGKIKSGDDIKFRVYLP